MLYLISMDSFIDSYRAFKMGSVLNIDTTDLYLN